ncbi:hypothetical protein ACFYKX_10170 [Cytobacillus sp. FJAT-54145]|uniref:Actin-like protein N-terminal domain-containing protein n=1 Tax=Cytobacillus spartinae TaxID=3299023 RepID=A0ABW6KE49_9BACI
MSHQNIRLFSADIGNDAMKGYAGEHHYYIPNVVAEIGDTRDYVELERNLLDGLHVEIESRALSKGSTTCAVGNLAMQYQNNHELTQDSDKSSHDQPLVLLLTTLAVDALKHFPNQNGEVKAKYYLSTGLPLQEATQKGKKKAFKEKIAGFTHVVTFKDTPEASGVRVILSFEDVLVNTEGHAAVFELTLDDHGKVKNENLTGVTLLIDDIGGLSTDAAIIHANGSVDNVNSEGMREGVSPSLDEIMKRVEKEYRYMFKSRREVVEVLTNPLASEKGYIYVKGKKTSIQHIADEILMRLAKREYHLLQQIWAKEGRIRFAFLIGGGSAILRPYLEQLNREGDDFPLRFVEAEDSIWMVSKAYFKILRLYLNQKKRG